MQFDLLQILGSATALTAGALVGVVFGVIQDRAARKNQSLQDTGKLTSGWAVMPGSMRRTAGFLMILAAVQIVCPLLFTNGYQWWVSGGVVAGYGWSLWRKLRSTLVLARSR